LLYHPDGSCRAAGPRDSQGRQVPDPIKFPSGMASLANYVHSKGLKFGIYTAIGPRTCANYTSSLGFEEIDAKTFAEWGIDFLKHDFCNADVPTLMTACPKMRDALNATGRPMVYYIDGSTRPRVYDPRRTDPYIATNTDQQTSAWGPKFCNMWKIWEDIKDFWASTLDNVLHSSNLQYSQGPGGWNMPDMLTVGQGAQTLTEYKSQFALWAVLAAPLLLGNDVRQMTPEILALLTNDNVLAVNRDPLGYQGSFARALGATEIWIKPLVDNTYAVVLLNKGDTAADVSVRFDVWLRGDFAPFYFSSARVHDIWTGNDLGVFTSQYIAKAVPSHGHQFVKITVIN